MNYFYQGSLFSFNDFIKDYNDNDRLILVLQTLHDYLEPLILKLEKERLGRRDKYPVRCLIYSLIAAIVYQIPRKSDLIRELSRNVNLRLILQMKNIPKPWHYSRLMAKLSHPDNLVFFTKAVDAYVKSLGLALPDFGKNLSIDGTAVSSYSNGRTKRGKECATDTDAAWGIRKKPYRTKDGKLGTDIKKWFGYIITVIIDADYELPIGVNIDSANTNETKKLIPMFTDLKKNHPEMPIESVIADAGYDSADNCKYVLEELNALPVIKMRLNDSADSISKTSIVHCNNLGVPICDDGSKMSYWGRDGNYLKFRCPAVVEKRDCKCKDKIDNCTTSEYGNVLKIKISDDPRLFPGICRESKKWKRLYRKRTASERVNSRLKEHLLLDQQYVRGKNKISVNILLSILTMQASALAMAKLDKLHAVRQILNMAA